MTKAVTIEPLAPRHAPGLQRIASDPRVRATTLLPEPYPPDGAASFVEYARGAWGEEYHWAIVDASAVVGAAALKEVHDGQGDVGYYVDPARWGEGIATAAVEAVCAFAFGDLGLRRVTARPLADNVPSCRVLEKAGFTREATTPNPFAKWPPEARMALYVREG